MKKCVTCHEIKPLDAFNVRRAAVDGLQARCRECSKDWYANNSGPHRAAVIRRNKRVKAENRQQLADYLAAHPCVDCGEGDIRVLDFDHRDGVDKRDEVSRMVLAAMSWRSIALEIAKCDVRCANCHRRRTIASKGWWRQSYFEQAEAQLAAESAARLATLLPVLR